MDKSDLQHEYVSLVEEIRVGSVADHELQITEFFNVYSSIAAENGDTPDLEYCPILREGNAGYRVDGYALDIAEGGDVESGDLYLAICDYRQQEEMPAINAKDVDRSAETAVRFFKAVGSDAFFESLEESSPAFQLAALIRQYANRIRRLRVMLFTNGHLRTRKSNFEREDVGHVSVHVNVLDLERYAKISSSGAEPVEIDFVEDFGGSIECLPASIDAGSYHSYLFAVPGAVLASVFATYGNRLLEQNVRTYLQARTNVNKGILRTISEEPEMFFAYNNGVTATASSVSTQTLPGGALAITHINDFQIVNGGQTTASLLYARDTKSADLEHVFVQVKLSVVDVDRLDEVVPRISEYANTQNKVSLADLASNSPVQIKIERVSKEVSTPQKAGDLHSRKWFYERARGQYRSLFSYKSQAEKKRLELEYPRNHLITKTDLAKYELSFDGEPHTVSTGAQKCFLKYTTGVLSGLGSGNAVGINETWYKRAVAKAILFKTLDDTIQQSDWYRSDRGYKAQIVTYTVAACADGFRKAGHQIDLDRIWQGQEVPGALLEWMLKEASRIAVILKNPPENVRNISEYAKKAFCWETAIQGKVGQPSKKLLEYGISLDDYADAAAAGKRAGKLNHEVDFDVALLSIVPQVSEIRSAAETSGLASPRNTSALSKLASGNINLTKSEKNALKALLERLEIAL